MGAHFGTPRGDCDSSGHEIWRLKIGCRSAIQYGGTSGGTANIEDVVPYDFATIYNVLPLWNAGTPIDGTGQTIAIVGTSDINPADITTFRSAFGLPAYAAATGSTPGFSVIHPNTAPGDCSPASNSCLGDLIENSLDVEWSGAIAKNASIILVASSPGTGTTFAADPVYISSNYIVENNIANIMNVSYGECELGLGTAGNAGWNTLWQTAYMAGIAAFVASGDEGSASCDAGGDDGGSNVPYGAQFGLSVSGTASTPYDTAVGGTDFNWSWVSGGQATYWNTSNSATTLASAKGYIPESPWNQTCSNTLLDASINSQLKENLSPAQLCDDIGLGDITFGGSPDFSLVDTVGGSGGVSACTTNNSSTVASCTGGYAKPSWQTGVTGIPNDGKRDIPDVSFFAADLFSGSAYILCVSNPGVGTCSYTAGTEPSGQEVGGTSVASPIMAGVMALINQKVGQSQGNPNPVLYQIAAKETYSGCSSESVPLTGSSCSFNDIDSGTIAMPCDIGSPNCTGTDVYGVLSGYSAGVGYDLATGLGSLNVANVVNAFAAIIAPAASLSPTSLTFAGVLVGTADPTQSVTLTNTGTDSLAISGISVTGANTGSFTQTNTCGTSLAGGAHCTITVTFTPAAAGVLSASISIADNAAGSPQTISLTGTGVVPAPIVSLSPTSLTFPATPVGTSAAAQTVTLTNTGTAPLTITTLNVTNGQTGQNYIATNSCGTVALGATCVTTVTFSPTAFGTLTGTLSFTDNAANSPQSVTLTGTGIEAGSYSLTASPVTATPGTAATSTITATGTGGFSGVITLNSCVIATQPPSATDLPTCTITSGTIAIASGSTTGTGTITIGSTAASAAVRAKLARADKPTDKRTTLGRWAGAGSAALAGLLLFGIPARRRNWKSLLGVLIFAAALATLSGCGGGGGGGGGGGTGTTAGAYTFTLTGTDPAGIKQTVTINVTVS